ncbi:MULTISPECIES: hypothetical protein [unclassified Erwinia]|uniref:hypothetical protein n=1 Tax=unclassified Erwinia TaxID=2622719 RepID=UPI000A973569|nr:MULTISPECIES: hypothetical protein [unclassified Erwinia]
MSITEAVIKCFLISVAAPIVRWIIGGINPFEISDIRLNFKLKFIKHRLEDVFLTDNLKQTLLEERKRLVMQKITKFENPVLQEAALMIASKSPDVPSPTYLSKFKNLLTVNEYGALCFSKDRIKDYFSNFLVIYITGCAILILGFYYGREDDIFLKTCIISTVALHFFSIRYATPGKKMMADLEKRINRAYNS